MRKLAVLAAAAAVFVFGAMAKTPEAEARRGYCYGGGGVVAALVIGGIVAASLASQRRSYGYYPRRSYYGSSYAYGGPSYYYSQPYYSRPVRVYRAGFTRGYYRGGRRWR